MVKRDSPTSPAASWIVLLAADGEIQKRVEVIPVCRSSSARGSRP